MRFAELPMQPLNETNYQLLASRISRLLVGRRIVIDIMPAYIKAHAPGDARLSVYNYGTRQVTVRSVEATEGSTANFPGLRLVDDSGDSYGLAAIFGDEAGYAIEEDLGVIRLLSLYNNGYKITSLFLLKG